LRPCPLQLLSYYIAVERGCDVDKPRNLAKVRHGRITYSMNIVPSRPDFIRHSAQGNLVPVRADLHGRFRDARLSLRQAQGAAGPSYLLESVEGGENLSRYSFIGCRPTEDLRLRARDHRIRVPGAATETIPTPPDPLTLIEPKCVATSRVACPACPGFTGGAVGFVGYEYVTRIEPTVPLAARDELGVPLLYFMLSDSLLIFDRAKQTLRLCVNAHMTPTPGRPTTPPSRNSTNSTPCCATPAPRPAPLVDPPRSRCRPAISPAAFEQVVENGKEFIRAGDIIQFVPLAALPAPSPAPRSISIAPCAR
jgi:anthranilate synthase component 1